MAKKWRCTVCGYIHEGPEAPDQCPMCKVGKEKFVEVVEQEGNLEFVTEHVIGDGKGAAIGAAIGTAVGAGTGAVIGKKMDKKAAELEALENAQVETVQDQNGLQAIKVTFNSGILFPTNGSTLSQTSKNELSQFATKMSDMQDTDITIYGHTDNTGSDAVNERLSNERAQSVATYLKNCGIASSRMTTEGKSYSMPVADNSTKEGRAQNRRVEIYITANKTMIEKAENGTL